MRAHCHSRIALSLAAFLFASSPSSAAPVLAYVSKANTGVWSAPASATNTAVASIVQRKQAAWGIAAGDPRRTATMTGIGAGVTALAVGGLGLAVGAATWPAVLLMAGASAVVPGLVQMGIDSTYSWLFGAAGIFAPAVVGAFDPADTGGYWAHSTAPGSYPYFPSALAHMRYYGATYAATRGAYTLSDCFEGTNPSKFYQCKITFADGFSTNIASFFVAKSGGFAWTGCKTDGSEIFTASGCGGSVYHIAPGSSPEVVDADAAAAIAAVPDAVAAEPMSSALLAAIANAIWKAMPPTPGAVPWSASDPVTPADVDAWRSENPSLVPPVGDLFMPVAAADASVAVFPVQGVAPSSSAPVTEGSGTQVDLGPDPNVGAPSLESTPLASSILAPVFNLMPDLKNFAVPSHTAECPKPSFSAFGQSYALESHCGLLEDNRSIIEAAMMLVFTIAAVFIVLRA